MFQSLGSSDGSGSELLSAIAGVDPESGLGRYGGVAAELALDPMNLVMGGAAGLVGKGVSAAGKAAKAARVAGATDDLAAGNRLAQAVGDAAGTYNPATMGPGNFPLGDAGQILPEMMIGGRKAAGVRAMPSNPNYPTILSGGPAARYADQVAAVGKKAGLNAAESRMAAMSANVSTNEAERAAAWASEGRPANTLGDLLGDDAGMVAAGAGRNPLIRRALASAGPSMNPALVQMGDTIPELEKMLAAAQGSPEVSPLLRQLMMVGGGGAAGGYAGSRLMQA